jgi:hypothetical protein
MIALVTVMVVADAAVSTVNATATSETYEAAGYQYNGQGRHAECGCSMLAAAEAEPDSPKHAIRLWNAGQCFQNAHLTGRALEMRLELIKAHPNDPLARRALARVTAGYSHNYYDCRHSWCLLAPTWAGESKEVQEALEAAMLQDVGESEDSPRAGVAAQAHFAEVIFESNHRAGALATHLARYLQRWSKYEAVDHQLRAQFLLGELTWRSACRKASEDGTCVETRTAAASRARPHFQAAVNLWKEGAAASGIEGVEAESRVAEATDAVAGALFYLAEKQYEDFLRLHDRASLRQLHTAVGAFEQVVRMRRAPWAVAAMARIAQLYAASGITGIATKASQAFEACLATATAIEWHGEWARLCERELNRLNGRRYPLPSEMTPWAMNEAPSRMSQVPLLTVPADDPCPATP